MRLLSAVLLSLFSLVRSEETYTILVQSEHSSPIDIHFFTHPAEFNGDTGEYTNSLGTKTVQPSHKSQATFTYTQTFYAAAQKLTKATHLAQTETVAFQPINLKSRDKEDGQKTLLTFDTHDDPVLSNPTTSAGVVNGSFQIQTPAYKGSLGTYGVGLGAVTNGKFELATYTLAGPHLTIDVQPIMKFYVSVGKVEKGVDARFISKSVTSALCDATTGTKEFKVLYRSDGQWEVNGKLQGDE